MRSGLFGWACAALQQHLCGQPAHEEDPLERLIGLVDDLDGPDDDAESHDHYLPGAPKLQP